MCIPTAHDFGAASFPNVSLFLRDKRAQRTKGRGLVLVSRAFALALRSWLIEEGDFGVIRACCTYITYKMVAFFKRLGLGETNRCFFLGNEYRDVRFFLFSLNTEIDHPCIQ